MARQCGLSQSYLSRLERGDAPGVTLEHLCLALRAVGLDLSAKAYPSGQPVRDKAQLGLLGDLRSHLPAMAEWRTEVGLRIPGDMRAWDAVCRLGKLRIGVEAETRLRDLQAVQRRLALKKRDDEMDRIILLVRASRSNRAVLRAFSQELAEAYPISSEAALRELAAGRDPGGDALIVL